MNLRGHTNEALLSNVRALIGSQRELTARLVLYLEEIEHRRLHVVAGFSSMFEFCVKALHLSEGEAFRRLAAARLGRQFPVIHSLIASGEVHLSALALLRPHLTEANHVELLEAVRWKSKRDVEMFLATRYPRPDEPTRMRPISSERFRIEFTASAELHEKLEHCLDLASHANPRRDLAFVIERAVELLLAKLERERLGKAKRPRPHATALRRRDFSASAEPPSVESPGTATTRTATLDVETPSAEPASRHVSNATRRFVFERDGDRCAYVSPDGHRCEATAFLELDHIVPRALGGGTEPENLRVRCRAHNRLWAEQTFGRACVERALNLRQRKRVAATNDGNTTNDRAAADETRSDSPGKELGKQRTDSSPNAYETLDVQQRVVLALEQLGFRHALAQRAVSAVTKRQCAGRSQTVEPLLREALLEATKAA